MPKRFKSLTRYQPLRQRSLQTTSCFWLVAAVERVAVVGWRQRTNSSEAETLTGGQRPAHSGQRCRTRDGQRCRLPGPQQASTCVGSRTHSGRCRRAAIEDEHVVGVGTAQKKTASAIRDQRGTVGKQRRRSTVEGRANKERQTTDSEQTQKHVFFKLDHQPQDWHQTSQKQKQIF